MSSLSEVGVLLICEYACVLSTLTSKFLVLSIFDPFFCSSIKCAILLVIKYFNSCFFFSKTSSYFLLA
jgi:hypothetical protein